MNNIDVGSCERLFAQLDEWMDRELTSDEVDQVERHLERCAVCASEYRIEGTLLRNIRNKVQRIHLPPEVEMRVWKRAISAAAEDLARE